MPPAPAPSRETPLAAVLADRIRRGGPLTFAEYMRECLYHAQFGYYSRGETRRFADYYTSVDVHPVFGRLLARQVQEMWEALERPKPFLLVEAGAGSGRLAAHLLDFAAWSLSEFYSSLQYVAVETSPARRAGHAETLGVHLAAGRVESSSSLPPEISAGCIFSNELLDALPVHRVIQRSGALCESYVTMRGGGFAEQTGTLSTHRIGEYFARQSDRLEEGQQAEAGLEACRWIEDAGRRLKRGFVLTIDYGMEAEELYDRRHLRGTLLAYDRHRASEEFYRAPGEQDLTAHVNFSAVELAGRRAGLVRTGLVNQSQFLMALGKRNDFEDLYENGQSEIDRLRARLLLKNLIHPEGMGETFRVLIQHKGIAQPTLAGLAPV